MTGPPRMPSPWWLLMDEGEERIKEYWRWSKFANEHERWFHRQMKALPYSIALVTIICIAIYVVFV